MPSPFPEVCMRVLTNSMGCVKFTVTTKGTNDHETRRFAKLQPDVRCVPSKKDMGKDMGCFDAERTSEDAAGSTQSDGLNESRFAKICHGRMVGDEESLRI